MKNWKEWMSWIAGGALVGALVAGCVPEAAKPPLDHANETMKSMEETIHEEGGLTAEEFSAGIASLRVDFAEAASKGATAKQMIGYGALGGVGGRSGLHLLSFLLRLVPGPWAGLLSPILVMLLGGSATGNKKR